MLLHPCLLRDGDRGLNFGALLFSRCHTLNELLAEHQPPKIWGRGHRFYVKPDHGNASRAQYPIFLGISTSRDVPVVRSVVEFHDALDRCVRITDNKSALSRL